MEELAPTPGHQRRALDVVESDMEINLAELAKQTAVEEQTTGKPTSAAVLALCTIAQGLHIIGRRLNRDVPAHLR